MNITERIEGLRDRIHNVRSRELQQLAVDADWEFKRQRGSHMIYRKGSRSLPIPTDPGPGTIRQILNTIAEDFE